MTDGYRLRLMRDRLEPGARLSLPPVNRVLYVLEGQLSIEGATLGANDARHRAGVHHASGDRTREHRQRGKRKHLTRDRHVVPPVMS